MSTTAVYGTSPVNPPPPRRPRTRSSKAQMAVFKARLFSLVKAMKPMTVRQVFYQATVRGWVEKEETGYKKVQQALVDMRKAREMPYGWLADNTRWQRKPRTFAGIDQALEQTAAFYRKALWDGTDAYVEVWLEKDALAGVVVDVTDAWDVPLMVARGYSSLSFLHDAAENLTELAVPAHIYHLGDYDPSGVNAGEKIEEALREFAPAAEIYFERLAVTPEQIAAWSLPDRPTKTTDTRAARFGSARSVELDAIEPARLRGLVDDAIARHLPHDQLQVLLEAERSERSILQGMVRRLRTEDDTP